MTKEEPCEGEKLTFLLATLPCRPACHERSISAPSNDWEQHHMAHRIIREGADFKRSPAVTLATSNSSEITLRHPQSPRDLPPLFIPAQINSQPRGTRQPSHSRLRSGNMSSNEHNCRSARVDDSPKTKTPYTPQSATTNSSTLSGSTLPTPVSATTDSRVFPNQWVSETDSTVSETPKEQTCDCARNIKIPQSAVETRSTASSNHRRNVSETSSTSGSIMDRGRPRKKNNLNAAKRTGSKRSQSAERRAFESLPKGWKATDVVQMLEQSEIAALQKQASQQAARFEIMRKEDVYSLSRVSHDIHMRSLRSSYSLFLGITNLGRARGVPSPYLSLTEGWTT